MKPKPPKTTAEATTLLERHAELQARMATIESDREARMVVANQIADGQAVPVLEEMAALAERLQPWWAEHGSKLTSGKRKSLALGGCMIGTKKSRSALDHPFEDDEAAAKALKPLRWAKPYLNFRVYLNRGMTTQGLDGPHAAKLAELGFHTRAGSDEFYIERIVQDGTIGADA